jgi:alpha-beta hydrolase superfamily lysophospholipase
MPVIRKVVIALVALMAVIYAAVGWYASGQIIAGLSTRPWELVYDIDVVAVVDHTVTIEVPAGDGVQWDEDATMGLRWEEGFGVVGPNQSDDLLTQTRHIDVVEGGEPPTGEDVAALDPQVFDGDPGVLGIEFETVTYPSPLGDLAAWYVDGSDETWVIAVHGLAAQQKDMLRFVQAMEDLDHPMLVITYRNDPGAPADGGLGTMGQTEWEDLQAAVDHARARGADSIVLSGLSMGGATILSYLMNTDDLSGIEGAILEAPAADLGEVVTQRSGEAIPIGGPIGDSLVWAGKSIAQLRTGIDFATIDYVERADELELPMLVMHGTEDPVVPFAIGEALAEARPDLIEFHSIPDAAHTRAWNEDRQDYCDLIESWLDRLP